MKLLNIPFEPARTPFDWLSRDNAEVDAFINDPLCFPTLKPESMQSFLDAFPRLADPREIRKVPDDLDVEHRRKAIMTSTTPKRFVFRILH